MLDWVGHGTRPSMSPATRSIGWAGVASMPVIQEPRCAAA
jgi:hypothetical protein